MVVSQGSKGEVGVSSYIACLHNSRPGYSVRYIYRYCTDSEEGGGGRKDVDDRRRRPSSSPHADIANQFYIAPWSGALSLLTQRNNSTVSRSAASIPIGPNQTLTCENNFIFSIKKSS